MFRLFVIICAMMIILFLRFRGLLKEKNFNQWLFGCLAVCMVTFVVACFGTLALFLDKFCPIWIAVIIAAVISLALMIVLKGLVDNEIKKFEFLKLKEVKKVPLERN